MKHTTICLSRLIIIIASWHLEYLGMHFTVNYPLHPVELSVSISKSTTKVMMPMYANYVATFEYLH